MLSWRVMVVVIAVGCGSSKGLVTAQPDGSAPSDASVKAFAGPPTVHRPTAGACPPTSSVGTCPAFAPDMGSSCRADTQCGAGQNGRCLDSRFGTCDCSYDACLSDADCGTTSLCGCAATGNTYGGYEGIQNNCLPSNCRIDSDCGSDQYCAPSLDETCGSYSGITRWACTTSKDKCRTDADCAGVDAGYAAPFCGYFLELGYWACNSAQCAG